MLTMGFCNPLANVLSKSNMPLSLKGKKQETRNQSETNADAMHNKNRFRRALKTAPFCNPAAMLLSFLMLVPPAVTANDWPCWRGPERNGISSEKGWRSDWPPDGPPIVWKASVGLGFSSISIANGRAFTVGHANEQDTVFCLDAKSGKEFWKHSYPAELGDKYFEGGTTGTPTVDGDRVFTLSRWGDVFCFQAAGGKIIWNRNLPKETGVRVPGWGYGGSPTVHENILLLNVGEAGMALDKTTGKTLWQSADKDAGYSTPLHCQEQGKWVVLLGSEKSYLAVDLLTGKEQWRMKWLTQYGVNAPDPIPNADRVFISTGYGKGAILIKPKEQAEPEVLWKSKVLGTQLNGAVLLDGYLYGLDGDAGDTAPLKCVEYATGIEKWTYPRIGTGGVIASDGKLIVTGSKGELMLFKATPAEPKILARVQVLGGKCWTAPVLANGCI
ncbi:MAG: alcohol dehydrogenase, partial [Pedosphaera sp.]|nr:alcohol dehydrogenase [Pedosphaera sp.]